MRKCKYYKQGTVEYVYRFGGVVGLHQGPIKEVR